MPSLPSLLTDHRRICNGSTRGETEPPDPCQRTARECRMSTTTAVFVQTNELDANRVIAFRRDESGALASLASYPTGGAGTGMPHLPSQGCVLLSGDGG